MLLRDSPATVSDDAVHAAVWSLDISQEMRLEILESSADWDNGREESQKPRGLTKIQEDKSWRGFRITVYFMAGAGFPFPYLSFLFSTCK